MERRSLLAGLTNDEAYRLEYDWSFWARPKQVAPDWGWLTWLIKAGRGFGKTRTGVEWVRSLVEGPTPLTAPENAQPYITIIGDTPADIRDFIIKGPSGFRACCPPDNRPVYNKSNRELVWKNGIRALLFSAEDPEALRGASGSCAWWDELAKARYAEEGWENLLYGLRESTPKVLVTTTPRVKPLIKRLIKDPTTHVTDGSTYENWANLSQSYFDLVIKPREGTRSGRQEIFGEFLEDVPGALWTYGLIEKLRVRQAPQLDRVLVAVDPPATSGENASECGIVCAGISGSVKDGVGYVLDDESEGAMSPTAWAKKAIDLYHKRSADRIVIEVNQGGEMAEAVLKQVDPTVPVKMVRASRGKKTRAEPASALYEKGRVHHVGQFSDMEDQMCGYTGEGDSPDRMDALVWALTDLFKLGGAIPFNTQGSMHW